jgi:nickel-dependent lactate racemase
MSDVQLRTRAWFGDAPLTIGFPPTWKVVELGPEDEPTMTADELRERLQHPIGSRRLADLAIGKMKAVMIVDDLTRPTPAADLLPLLIEELTRAGMPVRAMTVLLAGGTHPPASRRTWQKRSVHTFLRRCACWPTTAGVISWISAGLRAAYRFRSIVP